MLDPACLEGDAMPVEYVRSWTHACVSNLSLEKCADSLAYGKSEWPSPLSLSSS